LRRKAAAGVSTEATRPSLRGRVTGAKTGRNAGDRRDGGYKVSGEIVVISSNILKSLVLKVSSLLILLSRMVAAIVVS
jgi:hypothetical protein